MDDPKAPGKPNRMDRRRAETRKKLLNATLQLVIEKGIEKTTLDGITEAADLGRRTFYYHFEGKDECIQAAAAAVYQRHGESVDQLGVSEDPATIVALSVHIVLNGVLSEPITQCLLDRPRLLGGAFVDALGDFVQRDIAAGVESGVFQPAIKADMLNPMIMWSIVGMIIESYDKVEQRPDTLRAYAHTFLMILGVPHAEAAKASDVAFKLANAL